VDHGIRDHVPRYKNKQKKPDNGRLPIEHPSIIWLADKGHRVRQLANKLFKLCRKKKAVCIGTPMDAERLKRNLSYAIRVNCGGSLEEMRRAIESVLEHHFNNHSLCGEWCKVKNLEGPERQEAMLKYRCKVINAAFYLQVKELFDEFYKLLDEMMHGWDTNIVEGMNKFFTKFLPKDQTFAMTIENMVRLYLAISIDSVGYTEVYRRLGEKTGLTISEVNRTMNLELDEYKSYRRRYRKQERNKVRRMRKFYEKLQVGKQKLIADNQKSLNYSSGMAGPFAEDQTEEDDTNTPRTLKRKRSKTKPINNNIKCNKCFAVGHARSNSLKCIYNKKNMEEVKKRANEAREKGTYRMQHV
jgi:hypothetical protein